MAVKKMPIGLFVTKLQEAVARKDGYIMGAKGQNPKTWSVNNWYYTQYNDKKYTDAQRKKALYWREHAERVWDCNGLAEGIYKEYTGIDIDTRARYNYSGWCGTKGTGAVPSKYRIPGVAVFIHSKSAGYITHVGYLEKPIDASNPSGDWWVIEAKGVSDGVVRTKLSVRGWNRWGLMTKYFDYSKIESTTSIYILGTRTLRNGNTGNDVKLLQEALIRLDYDCGRWGADGDFGDATEIALREFQKDNGLTVDGVFGKKSFAAIEAALAKLEATIEKPTKVKIVGGNCYIRTKSDKTGEVVAVARRNSTFEYGGTTAQNGWNSIVYDGDICWVSGMYSQLVSE